jgi:Pyruvate/2-oxoacid:ferredoxin oxidoreductase delta subunit
LSCPDQSGLLPLLNQKAKDEISMSKIQPPGKPRLSTQTKKNSRLGWLLKPSSLAFLHEARKTQDYNLFDLLHGYIYGRWIFYYISFGTGRHTLARRLLRFFSYLPKRKNEVYSALESRGGMAEIYHGKVLPLEAARQLILVGEEVRLENLETIIPYARAKDLILQNPDHLVVLDCPCRAALANPCLPLDVCLIIGEPFASFVSDHHPQRSRWISPEEAVSILQAEEARGHVHHAFFKDAMLGRFYAICNCCKCCCGAIQSQSSGNLMLAPSGYTAHVDEDLCIACESCLEFCQFDALEMQDFQMQVREQSCMGCGVCVSHCPHDALSLVRDASKGEPLEILQLLKEAR